MSFQAVQDSRLAGWYLFSSFWLKTHNIWRGANPYLVVYRMVMMPDMMELFSFSCFWQTRLMSHSLLEVESHSFTRPSTVSFRSTNCWALTLLPLFWANGEFFRTMFLRVMFIQVGFWKFLGPVREVLCGTGLEGEHILALPCQQWIVLLPIIVGIEDFFIITDHSHSCSWLHQLPIENQGFPKESS